MALLQNSDNSILKDLRKKAAHNNFKVSQRHNDPEDRFGVIISRDGGRCLYEDKEKELTIAVTGRVSNKDDLAKRFSEANKEDAYLIAKGYLEYGEKIFDSLEGYFCAIIWDKKNHRFLAYRDHMGAIPLFFSLLQNGIVVSTEIGSLWPKGLLPRDLDRQAIFNYLHEKSFLPPFTPYCAIKSLDAGELLEYDSGKIAIEKRYRLQFVKCAMEQPQALEELESTLLKVMEEQIAPFSEIGILLSGGNDSLFLISVLKSLTHKPIRTYTILMETNAVDEEYANKAAAYFGAKHKNIFLTDELIQKHAKQIVCNYQLPTIGGWHVYFGTHAAKEDGVSATMAGFGGEIGFGIPFSEVLNRIHQCFKLLDELPTPLNRFSIYFLENLANKSKRISHITNELYRYLCFKQGILMWHSGKLRESDILTVMSETPGKYDSIRFKYLKDYRQSNTNNFLEQLTYARLLHFEGNAVLGKLNTLAEKNSVELLLPLLDRRMLEVSFRIPFEVKAGQFRHLQGKIASKYHHFRRKKSGFVMPFDKWLKTLLCDAAEKAFSPHNIERQGIFDPVKLPRLWEGYLAGNSDLSWSDIYPFVTLSQWIDDKDRFL